MSAMAAIRRVSRSRHDVRQIDGQEPLWAMVAARHPEIPLVAPGTRVLFTSHCHQVVRGPVPRGLSAENDVANTREELSVPIYWIGTQVERKRRGVNGRGCFSREAPRASDQRRSSAVRRRDQDCQRVFGFWLERARQLEIDRQRFLALQILPGPQPSATATGKLDARP